MFNVPKYQFKTFHPNKYVKNVPKTINGPRGKTVLLLSFPFIKIIMIPIIPPKRKEVNNAIPVILQPRKSPIGAKIFISPPPIASSVLYTTLARVAIKNKRPNPIKPPKRGFHQLRSPYICTNPKILYTKSSTPPISPAITSPSGIIMCSRSIKNTIMSMDMR